MISLPPSASAFPSELKGLLKEIVPKVNIETIFGSNIEDMSSETDKEKNKTVKLRKPLPDIQTYYGVKFQYGVPVTTEYFDFPQNQTASDLNFSGTFDPHNSTRWCRFDSTKREFSGTPLREAVKNTTVSLNIEGPGRGIAQTFMHIIVSEPPNGVLVGNYGLSKKAKFIIGVSTSLFGVVLIGIIVRLLIKRKRVQKRKESLQRDIENSDSMSHAHPPPVNTMDNLSNNLANSSELYAPITNRHSLFDRRREHVNTYANNIPTSPKVVDPDERSSILSTIETKSTYKNSRPSSLYSANSFKIISQSGCSLGRSIPTKFATLHLPNDVVSTFGGYQTKKDEAASVSGSESLPEDQKQSLLTEEILRELRPPLSYNFNYKNSFGLDKNEVLNTNRASFASSRDSEHTLKAYPPQDTVKVIEAQIREPLQYHVRLAEKRARKELKAVLGANNEPLPSWLHFGKQRPNLWGVPMTFDTGKFHVKIFEYVADSRNEDNDRIASGLGIKLPPVMNELDWRLVDEIIIWVKDDEGSGSIDSEILM
ncbi:hypothetical protein G9A89_001773 [Geosiphon pyriformis]|nr:hypothetical protein G9A89_001773 [Geosiphon pyriformis]